MAQERAPGLLLQDLNKKDAEQRSIDRRKEALEGIVPASAIKVLALDALETRYLAFVEHQRGVAAKKFHFLGVNQPSITHELSKTTIR